VAAVNGLGERFKSGGRVMKNVTGYDLSKLLTGSWGTLAAITELTLKVLPAPEIVTTLALHGLSDAMATAAMTAALGSSHEVSGAAHLPARAATRAALGNAAATILRLEGFARSVAARASALSDELAGFGAAARLEDGPSRLLWRQVRDVAPLLDPGPLPLPPPARGGGFQNLSPPLAGGDGARSAPGEGLNPPNTGPLWRVSTAPTHGHKLVAALAPAEALYDWGGGLVWLALGEGEEDAGAARLRAALAPLGGHATLIRAPAAVRARVPVFEPQPPALAALTRRVKASFDPRNVLNPGRMVAET